MQVPKTLKNLNKQLALALVFTLLLQSVAAAATIVKDTFADANSQNQELSNNSVRIFNGRAGTVRTDAAGSVNFNISAAGGSEGFWGFFADGAPVTLGVLLSNQPGTVFPLGTTQVTASAQDSKGLTATGAFNVTVRDMTAPVFRNLTATPATITQNNGKLVPVTIAASVADAVDSTPATRIISVADSDNVAGEWQITGDLTLQVRAKRSGKARRVYTVTVESRDAAGHVSTRTVTVTVR